MASFLDLPNDLLASVVTDWLSWKAVGQLDSAICSKNNRNRWLDLLKKDCIFRCVNVDYHLPNNYSWCIARQIRMQDFSFTVESIVNDDQEAAASWLHNTAQFITTLNITSISGTPISYDMRGCSKLRTLFVNKCILDETFWELVRNNPNLEMLCIQEEYRNLNFVVPVPTDLSLSKLKKLNLKLGLVAVSCVAALFQQIPALESLKLNVEFYNYSNFYDCLPDSCPKLVYLDLEKSNHIVGDAERFFRLMKSLKCGLRCLVLPAFQILSVRELQSIAQYHYHSLRCLSIPCEYYWNLDPVAYNIADLINSLPHLHTLSIVVYSLPHKTITNPTITHLVLDYCGASDMSIYSGHCPAATTLTLSRFYCDSVEATFINLPELRPLIHTLCVDDDEVMLQLREALPTITIRKSTGIDIFEQEY